MEIVPVQELESLNTKELLARLQRLRFCEESSIGSDLSEAEIATVSDKILFKSDPSWRTAYRELKAILDRREHQPKG